MTAGTTYEAQVRAVTTEEGEGPWSDIGEGTANRAPTGASLEAVTMTWGTTHDVSLEDAADPVFTDSDDDTLSYQATAQYPGFLRVGLTGTTVSVKALNPAPNGGSSTVTYRASDPYGGYATSEMSVAVTGNVTRSVSERASGGASVGAPVAGTPYYGEEDLTHTLTGDVASAFVISAASGQISVKQGATLDHETKSSYTGQVGWTVQGQAAVANLTIYVLDGFPPRTPDAPAVTGSRGNSTNTLDVDWTAPDATGRLPVTDYDVRYRVAGAGSWTDHPFTGTATSTAIGGVKAGITYEVQVLARNVDGDSFWSASGRGGIAVLASIQAPSDPVTEGSSVSLPVSLSSSMDVAVTVSWHTTDQPDAASANLAAGDGAGGASGQSADSPVHEHTNPAPARLLSRPETPRRPSV